LAEGKIEILEKKHNKILKKIKEYQEGIYYLNIIEEILEKSLNPIRGYGIFQKMLKP